MSDMTIQNAIHCMRAMICEEVCEECDYYGKTGTDHCEADAIRMAIKALEEQTQRKKGKWIKLDMHAHIADHKCTACGQECYVPTCMGEPMYTYCPNCGARMEGESE